MTVPSTAWTDRAACAGDPAFTADHGRGARAANHLRSLLAVCQACPVLAECAVYASQLRWSGVVVAGWVAPEHPARRPTL